MNMAHIRLERSERIATVTLANPPDCPLSQALVADLAHECNPPDMTRF